MKILFSLVLFTIAFLNTAAAQMQMLYGKNHAIFAMIPEKWQLNENKEIPFFLKPERAEVNPMTYMYVLGIDYETTPVAKDWVAANNEYLLKKMPEVKIKSTKVKFSNLKRNGYLTGKYEAVTYAYPNDRKEIILAIECEKTIVSVVLSAKDATEFKKLYKDFKELVKSLRITEAEVDENAE